MAAKKSNRKNNKVKKTTKLNLTKETKPTLIKNNYEYSWKEEFITKGKVQGDLLIRLPVEFNLFGKLKPHSKKIIFKLLKANVALFCYNFANQYSFNKAIKKEDIKRYINRLSKHRDSCKYTDPETYEKEYFFYYDKLEDVWYYALNFDLLAFRYLMWKRDFENKEFLYIPFKHNIYNILDVNNKKESDLIGKLSLYNRTKHTVFYFSDCTKSDKRKLYGLYKFYTCGKMLEERNISCINPFRDINQKDPMRYNHNSFLLFLNYMVRKRISE